MDANKMKTPRVMISVIIGLVLLIFFVNKWISHEIQKTSDNSGAAPAKTVGVSQSQVIEKQKPSVMKISTTSNTPTAVTPQASNTSSVNNKSSNQKIIYEIPLDNNILVQ
jgi:hypothetical protein